MANIGRRIQSKLAVNFYVTVSVFSDDMFLVLHIGTFRLTVGVDDGERYYTCVEITDPIVEKNEIFEKILTCSEAYTINKIIITNTGEGPLKVYEIKQLGMTLKVSEIVEFLKCITARFKCRK